MYTGSGEGVNQLVSCYLAHYDSKVTIYQVTTNIALFSTIIDRCKTLCYFNSSLHYGELGSGSQKEIKKMLKFILVNKDFLT